MGRGRPRKAIQPTVGNFVVEKIVGRRIVGVSKQYLVKWVGWPESENTWENKTTLKNAKELIQAFHTEEESKKAKTDRDSQESRSSGSKPDAPQETTKNEMKRKIISSSADDVQPRKEAKKEPSSVAELNTQERCSGRVAAPPLPSSEDSEADENFDSGFFPTPSDPEPLAIMAVDEFNGQKWFIIKFVNEEVLLIQSKVARDNWPELVTLFYQGHVIKCEKLDTSAETASE